MKIILPTVIAASMGLGASTAYASEFSLGIIVGEPTGLSAKQTLRNGNAIAGAAAWSLSENESLQVHVDYLFNQRGLNTPSELRGTSHWYWGVGGRLKVRENNKDDDVAGVRVPFGINFYPQTVPLEVFGELVPVFDVVPDSDVDFNGALGLRYRFQ